MFCKCKLFTILKDWSVLPEEAWLEYTHRLENLFSSKMSINTVQKILCHLSLFTEARQDYQVWHNKTMLKIRFCLLRESNNFGFFKLFFYSETMNTTASE